MGVYVPVHVDQFVVSTGIENLDSKPAAVLKHASQPRGSLLSQLFIPGHRQICCALHLLITVA